MANYSRFYGEVLFYNKKIKNTEDNRIRFKKFLSDFIEYNDSRNPSFELCDDIYFDEESEYLKTTRMFFNSEAKWTYQNGFQDILIMDIADIGIMNNTSKEAYRLEDFIGFGINVIGTDLEEGCRSFYDYRGIKEVAGVRDNHHLIISFLVNEVTPKEYNAKNINEFEANLIYGDLFTVYGIDVFFHTMMKDYREYDSEFNLVIKKYAPTLVSLYENNLLGNYLLNDIQEDLCSIILKIIQEEYTKNNSPIDGIINLEDIDFLMIEDKDDKKLVLNYDNTAWYTIFQNIETSLNKYIDGRGLKICQITS